MFPHLHSCLESRVWQQTTSQASNDCLLLGEHINTSLTFTAHSTGFQTGQPIVEQATCGQADRAVATFAVQIQILILLLGNQQYYVTHRLEVSRLLPNFAIICKFSWCSFDSKMTATSVENLTKGGFAFCGCTANKILQHTSSYMLICFLEG